MYMRVVVISLAALLAVCRLSFADATVTSFTPTSSTSVEAGQSVTATVHVTSLIFSGPGQVTFTTSNATLAAAPATINVPSNFNGNFPVTIVTNGGSLTRAGTVTIRAIGDQGGNIPLVITVRPTSDSCSRAFTIGNGSTNFTTVNATTDGFSDFCGSAQQDIWLRYTATCSGMLNINIVTSAFNIRLHTYNANCPSGNNQSVGCISTVVPSLTTSRFVNVGDSLLFRVGSTVSGAGGTGTGTITLSCVVPNDNCASAQQVFSGQTVTANTAGATTDGADCGPGTRDIWYTFTATGPGRLHVDTCGTESMSSFDTALAVYSGCPGVTGNMLACNDDHGAIPCIGPGTLNDSAAEVNLVHGQQVFIRVNGTLGVNASSAFQLHVRFTPSNDTCAGAIDVSAGGTFIGTLTGAAGNGSSSCSPPANSPDVWYRYTAPCPGVVTVSTCGSHDIFGQNEGSDTALSLHTLCPPNGVELACSDNPATGTDPCGDLDNGSLRDAFVETPLAVGQTIFIRVSSPGTSFPGPFFLNVSFTPTADPANDSCNSAQPVGLGAFPFCNVGASNSPPLPSCGGGRNDVFFRFEATCHAFVTVGTCTVTFDASLAIYDQAGCPTSAADEIACDLNSCAPGAAITFEAQEGHAYLIRVGGDTAADEGSGILTITQRCICPCDWNLDLVLDSQDYFDFLNDFFNANADFNLDGVKDSQDFFDYIECFFNAPPVCRFR